MSAAARAQAAGRGWATSALSWALWAAIGYWLVLPMASWAFHGAVLDGTAAQCRQASGACWAFVREKLLFVVIGFQSSLPKSTPIAFLALALVKAVLLFALPRRVAPLAVALGCCVATSVVMVLSPATLGLSVESNRWSGLLLTLSLSLDALPAAFLLGIALAFGRTSSLPVLRLVCAGVVDTLRAVPLISILFVAALVAPLFLVDALTPDKLARGWLAFVVFAAAYFAEAVRGGLLAVDAGQIDASRSLGLRGWQIALLVRLPQALRTSLPALTSNVVAFTKDSSLISIIGISEFFSAMKFALSDPNWLGFFVEGYFFVGLVYFCLCQAILACSRRYERCFAIPGRGIGA